MSLWQLAKDKKRRVAQKLAERRASMKSTGEGEDPYDDPYYKADPGFLEDRAAFKDYVKASKHVQKKVAALTMQVRFCAVCVRFVCGLCVCFGVFVCCDICL